MTVRVGELRHTIVLEEQVEGDDGYGGVIIGWQDQGSVPAKFHFLRGGEEVMAGRIAGKQPAIITVRSDSLTRQVTPAWRIRDAEGEGWNIRAITDPTGRRAWLEILAEKGVPG